MRSGNFEVPAGVRGLDQASPPRVESRSQAVLAYALAAFSGILLLVLRREDRFVQYHALQSIGATAAAMAIAAVLWLFSFFPLLGFLYGILFWLFKGALFLYWVFLLVRAWQGKWHRIPLIGRWAERQLL